MIIEKSTPIEIVSCVSRVVTVAADQLLGERSAHPLLVAHGCVEALAHFRIKAVPLYGKAAWIEILEDQTPVWAGSTDAQPHFWVETQFDEKIDLNASVAHQIPTKQKTKLKPKYSPPILWSQEVPRFYFYQPEGIAEIDPKDEKFVKNFQTLTARIRLGLSQFDQNPKIDFPNEAIIAPDRRVLDDTENSFQHFDRALAVKGIPKREEQNCNHAASE